MTDRDPIFGMSKRQQIALLYLGASWCEQDWTAVDAVLRMFGFKGVNGNVTCRALVRKGLAAMTAASPARYGLTQKGGATALLIKLVDGGNVKAFNVAEVKRD